MAKKKKSEKMAEPVMPSNDDWKSEDDFRTLMRAEEIKQDEDRMKGVRKHSKKQKKSIKSVDDLVNYRNAKYGPGADANADDEE